MIRCHPWDRFGSVALCSSILVASSPLRKQQYDEQSKIQCENTFAWNVVIKALENRVFWDGRLGTQIYYRKRVWNYELRYQDYAQSGCSALTGGFVSVMSATPSLPMSKVA